MVYLCAILNSNEEIAQLFNSSLKVHKLNLLNEYFHISFVTQLIN